MVLLLWLALPLLGIGASYGAYRAIKKRKADDKYMGLPVHVFDKYHGSDFHVSEQVDDLSNEEQEEYQDRQEELKKNLVSLDLITEPVPPPEPFEEEEEVEPEEEVIHEKALALRAKWQIEKGADFEKHADEAVKEDIGGAMLLDTELKWADFEERVEREGGSGGVLQITLLWNNYNDLDLHVFTPSMDRIYFNNRKTKCGGELDIDMNIKPTSNSPIENVVWKEQPAKGVYRVHVFHYASHKRPNTTDPTKYRLRIMYKGKTKEYEGEISHGDPMKLITSFSVK